MISKQGLKIQKQERRFLPANPPTSLPDSSLPIGERKILRVGTERDLDRPAGIPWQLQARRRHTAVLLVSPSARARALARMAVDALDTGERLLMFDGEGLLAAETMALMQTERPDEMTRVQVVDLTDPSAPGIDLFSSNHGQPVFFADLAHECAGISMVGRRLAAAVAEAFGLLNQRLSDEGHLCRLTLKEVEQFTRDEVMRADVLRTMPLPRLLEIYEPEQRLVHQISDAELEQANEELGNFCRSLMDSPLAHLFTDSGTPPFLPELPALGSLMIIRADGSSPEGRALLRMVVLQCVDQATQTLNRDPVTGMGGREQAIILGDDFTILDEDHLFSMLVDSMHARCSLLFGMSQVGRETLLSIVANCPSVVFPRFTDKFLLEVAIGATTNVKGYDAIDWSSLTDEQAVARMTETDESKPPEWVSSRSCIVQLPVTAIFGKQAVTKPRLDAPSAGTVTPPSTQSASTNPVAEVAPVLEQMPDLEPAVHNSEDGSYQLMLPYLEVLHCNAGGPAEWDRAAHQHSWYRYGRLHRVDAPAIEDQQGRREWYLYGQRHRESGPAVLVPPKEVQWWLHGVRIDLEPEARDRLERWHEAEAAYERSLMPMSKRTRRIRA